MMICRMKSTQATILSNKLASEMTPPRVPKATQILMRMSRGSIASGSQLADGRCAPAAINKITHFDPLKTTLKIRFKASSHAWKTQDFQRKNITKLVSWSWNLRKSKGYLCIDPDTEAVKATTELAIATA